jgi:oxalate decarboxylase/phosphoglucose isomerase-like protein (cupin superfamily)
VRLSTTHAPHCTALPPPPPLQHTTPRTPGGRYKASTNATLTATTIAGNLVQLKAGGLRELHWHDVAEWAFVIEGACQ